MLRPDRLVALAILGFCLGYGYLALDYQLLPFERSMAFKPTTLPVGLAALGVVLSLAVLFAPGGAPGGLSSDAAGWRAFDWPRFAGIVVAMAAYAPLLGPLGYIAATVGFLVVGAVILGERRFSVLLPVALAVALGSWALVDRVLGIFMRPLPAFLA